VVHGIIKKYRGFISLFSKPETGTAFVLYFPAAEQFSQEEQLGKDKVTTGDKEHIMIVEDEQSLARLYQITLSEFGYRLSVFNNGTDALTSFRKQADEYDLVFTDQTMPRMTGMDLSHELLKIRPDLPIILATGYVTDSVAEFEKSTGIRHYFKKPVNMGLLNRKIREQFDKS